MAFLMATDYMCSTELKKTVTRKTIYFNTTANETKVNQVNSTVDRFIRMSWRVFGPFFGSSHIAG